MTHYHTEAHLDLQLYTFLAPFLDVTVAYYTNFLYLPSRQQNQALLLLLPLLSNPKTLPASNLSILNGTFTSTGNSKKYEVKS
jgi:hypothetical protein